jgi:transcriptional regulator with XRE-family HTH domain
MENITFSPKEFGHRLKKAREKADILQVVLAEKLDISPRTLLEIEAGRTEMSISKVFLTAKELSVTVNYLLGIPEGDIINSFNSIQQEANAQQGINPTHIAIDRDWASEVNKRFAFYEDQIREKDRLLSFLMPLKPEAT